MTAAYFASVLESLPELLRLRPHLRASDESSAATAQGSHIYRELAELHQRLKADDLLNRRARRALQRHPTAAAATAPTTSTRHASAHVYSTAVPTTSSTHIVLQKDTDDLWRAASEEAKQAPTHTHPFTLATKLQHELTVEMEKEELTRLMEDSQPFQHTILAELSHASGSGAWMLALPTQPAYRLNNEEYHLAVRKRLGILPHS
jgi:hypothetical protein